MSAPHKSTSDDVQHMSLTDATINDGVQFTNLTNGDRNNVQYMNLPNSANDGVRYMNLPSNANDGLQYMDLLNATNNDVRYKNVSNPMALLDDDESNDEHQGKSDQLVSVAMYVLTFQFPVSSMLQVVNKHSCIPQGTTGKQLMAATNSVIYDKPRSPFSPIITTDHLKLRPNPAYGSSHNKVVMDTNPAYMAIV